MASAPGYAGGAAANGGALQLERHGRHVFFVDPAQDLFAILLTQAPGAAEMLCELFPTLVYAAL